MTDSAGGQDIDSFTWIVDDRRFGTLTARERRTQAGGSSTGGYVYTPPTSNQVTVSGPSEERLYLVEGIFDLSVGPATGVPMPRMSDILFAVQQPASPATGNFDQSPEIRLLSPPRAPMEHGVVAGIDVNLDGTLQDAEASHWLYVAWLSYMGGGVVHAKRISGLSQEPLFPVKPGERFEEAVSGFEFQLVALGAYGPHSLIRYNVREESVLVDPRLYSGSGPIFQIQFPSTGGPRNLYVEFYVDSNDSGTWDATEPFGTRSATFIVQPLHVIDVTVEYSDLLPFLNAAAAQQALAGDVADGLQRLQRKDTLDDYRAAVDIRIGNPASFVSNPTTRPDPVTTVADARLHWANSNANLIYVSSFTRYRGLTNGVGGTEAVIDWNDRAADTSVHEIGHMLRLNHSGTDQHIMHEGDGPTPRAPGSNLLLKNEADAFSTRQPGG